MRIEKKVCSQPIDAHVISFFLAPCDPIPSLFPILTPYLKSGPKRIDHKRWYAYVNINYCICFFHLTHLVAKPLYELAILLILYDIALAFSQQQAKLLAML